MRVVIHFDGNIWKKEIAEEMLCISLKEIYDEFKKCGAYYKEDYILFLDGKEVEDIRDYIFDDEEVKNELN
jgi:hypothetical protein